jgi:hypothetical protein
MSIRQPHSVRLPFPVVAIRTLLMTLIFFCFCLSAIRGDDEFATVVQPYVNRYCLSCHNATEAKGELDFTKFSSPRDVIDNFRRWSAVLEFVKGGEMPPEDSPQPDPTESARMMESVRSILTTEARRRAGDPGFVPARRLSHSEYDRSVRDLTGIDIRPTRDFPADPAAGEGFDNTGEALSIGPGMVRKYLAAAQFTADHMVLHTTGLRFAPFAVNSGNERRKLTENAVIEFYRQHDIDLSIYLAAAWRYRFRSSDDSGLSASEYAVRQRLSVRYFETLMNFLTDLPQLTGCPQELQAAWISLPAPSAGSPETASVPAELQQLLQLINRYRRLLHAPEGELIRANAGNWPIGHLDFRAKTAAARMQFSTDQFRPGVLLRSQPIPGPAKSDVQEDFTIVLQLEPALGTAAGQVLFKRPVFSKSDRLPNNDKEISEHQVVTLRDVLTKAANGTSATFGKAADGGEIDVDSFVAVGPSELRFTITADQQRELQGRRLLLPLELQGTETAVTVRLGQAATQSQAVAAASGAEGELLAAPQSAAVASLRPFGEKFCRVFPNRFVYVDPGRGLEAGFHLVEGFFRDDQPLQLLVLNDEQRQQLESLWQELEFVNTSAETLLRGFVWFERSEREVLHDKRFDFLRSEDPALVHEDLLARFETLYLDKLGCKRDPETGLGVDEKSRIVLQFFTNIRHGLKLQSERLTAAETRGLADLQQLAERAWRRELTAVEREQLLAMYRQFRSDGQGVEQALRGVFTTVLMSPHFCCLWQTPSDGPGVSAISSGDLASRLSYFLWSSLPDDSLKQAAVAGRLSTADGLATESQRMLKDPRVEGMAREFFGQWLRYRDFEQKDPINAAAFPGYDDKLRTALAEEPVRLAMWLIQQDRPVTELLIGDTGFLNARLAGHYGGLLEQSYRTAAAARKTELAAAGASRQQLDAVGEEWLQINGFRQAGRGGLLGMAVVLAKNSAGERSSPVKRGFWTVHHLLGRHFPPPPADVPELPKNEQQADRSLRELLAAHVADSQCAMCHKHFDSLGLALEGFDAIGRSRTKDAAGRPIDATAVLLDGKTVEGVTGLADYLLEQRRQEFLQTLCRRFLGYALGRSVQLSDQSLLDEMQTALESDGMRFSVLVDRVVRSPQFRMVRNREFTTAGP